jgi:transposase
MPGGRPTAYRPEYCQKVIALGAKGKSKAQIAAALHVVRDTLDNWAEDNPEFLCALKTARERALAWWEAAGVKGMFAERFNATAYIFQMKNRFREEYRDVNVQEHTGKVEVEHTDARNEINRRILGIASRTGQDGDHPKPNGSAVH